MPTSGDFVKYRLTMFVTAFHRCAILEQTFDEREVHRIIDVVRGSQRCKVVDKSVVANLNVFSVLI
jgi:hypothetical protein